MPARKKKVDDPSDVLAWIESQADADPILAAGIAAERARLELARRVRQLRERRRLSQAELAALAGTKQPNIARLESGRSSASLTFLAKVASALGAKLDVRLLG